MHKKTENLRDKRLTFFLIMTLCGFALLTLRILWIQTFKHEIYSTAIKDQMTREIEIVPNRGTIFDRNLIPLTNNVKIPTVFAFKKAISRDDTVKKDIMKLTNMDEMTLNEQISQVNAPYIELPIENEADLAEKVNPGYIITNQILRYGKDHLLAHVIGYINNSENKGVSGLEASYDNLLTMEDQYKRFVFKVDGKDSILPQMGIQKVNATETSTVNSIKLTIDYSIQKMVEKIMDEQKIDGAVIVTEVDTGDILAMSSRPNINPNNLVEHFDSPKNDLYNKAINMDYPPASLFKIVVLLAAMDDPNFDLNETYNCNGYEKIGRNIIKCHAFSEGGHGEIDVEEAFYDSCNSVFIQIGEKIGSKRIIEKARTLGFGELINIPLSQQSSGNLPSGNDILGPAIGNISIGQGKIEVTPLQITNMMMILANDGIKKPLILVDGLVRNDGTMVKTYEREPNQQLLEAQDTYMIKEFMKKVVTEGTGKNYVRVQDIGGAAGKTGTAQAKNSQSQEVKHVWFSGYYPNTRPKYVVTVLVENGLSGGKTAGPIFEEIIRYISNLEK